jgi:hypothetical protein
MKKLAPERLAATSWSTDGGGVYDHTLVPQGQLQSIAARLTSNRLEAVANWRAKTIQSERR